METNCCVCGIELTDISQVIDTEISRRLEEESCGLPVPNIGVVCNQCSKTYNSLSEML